MMVPAARLISSTTLRNRRCAGSLLWLAISRAPSSAARLSPPWRSCQVLRSEPANSNPRVPSVTHQKASLANQPPAVAGGTDHHCHASQQARFTAATTAARASRK